MVIRNKMAQNVGPPKSLQMKSFPEVSRNDVVETSCVFFISHFSFKFGRLQIHPGPVQQNNVIISLLLYFCL